MSSGWKMIAVEAATTFKDLCDAKGVDYAHGCGYYQLVGSENVSASKLLVACNEDDGEVLAGVDEVRKRLSIGDKTKIAPADVPKPWTLYVNSTSSNRGLKPKTTVMIRTGSAKISDVASAPIQETTAPHGGSGVGKARSSTPTKSTRPEVAPEESITPRRSRKEEEPKPAPSAPVTSATSGGAGTLDSFTKWTQRDADGWVWAGTLWASETKSPAPAPSTKIASFDYDGCLADTSLFRKGPDAWKVLFPNTKEVLTKLHKNGYRLVIMSNQSTIGKATKSKDATIAEKKGRFEGFVKAMDGLPFTVMVATAATKEVGDPFRKPAPGMWAFLEENLNGGVAIDKTKSFFVGDAAGRKKDHSDSDLKCAAAYGVPFFTEKEMFAEGKYEALLA